MGVKSEEVNIIDERVVDDAQAELLQRRQACAVCVAEHCCNLSIPDRQVASLPAENTFEHVKDEHAVPGSAMNSDNTFGESASNLNTSNDEEVGTYFTFGDEASYDQLSLSYFETGDVFGNFIEDVKDGIQTMLVEGMCSPQRSSQAET